MSVVLWRLSDVLSHTASTLALNPVFTASLLYILTKGPPTIRDRLFSRFAALRDPQRLTTIVKVLKWLLGLGLLRNVNGHLNKIALNAWRLRSEKNRWHWNQEIAVVTGGCSGIGERVVKGLVKKGLRVAVLDIQQLPPTLQGYANIKFFACDITDPTAVNTTAERIRATMGSPSILVNNAGIALAHTILDTSDEFLRKIFDVNCLSNFTTVKAFMPDMIAANKGQVVTVASLASYLGVGGMADYCSTKAAVLSFHEALNMELKHKYNAPGIITTSVHPNWVQTPLIKSWEKDLRASRETIIQPQEVADAIVNQILSCSGGQIFIPNSASGIARLRGYSNWVQEYVRSMPTKIVLGCQT
ncbi:dehydrogenase/reductase SDR family member 8 precursor [Polyplosphaeria fusca]|uniref:Short-chain dehydrogenase/reductase 3 n=1 Tax=Polyplosphaeria fusca TaxID=682080 RepID=A0A9P4V5Y9_9PLEO|nr:dehydrogenase/reductase SDR family member 8 precursor [Polyplosphaeria fusca]